MVDLLNHFNDKFSYDPTGSQIESLEKLQHFLENDSCCYILSGTAGSGKTSLVAALVHYIKDNNQYFRLMGPTGRAARVLYEITGFSAFTIHKSIYSLNKISQIKNDLEQNSESFKYYFGLQENSDPSNTIYIVDEASMVSDQYSDNEFFRFGSGRLLSDLFTWSEIRSENNNRKIIFVGDNAQLPPVNMNFSPALNSNYLDRSQLHVKTEESYLKEVVRQKSNSGILINANNIREKIDDDHFSSLKIMSNKDDIIPIHHNEILTHYLPLYENKKDPIMIAYSNNSVYNYNSIIRGKIFPDSAQIQIDDKVLIAKNNYKYGVLNGEFGTVAEIHNEIDEVPITLQKKGGKITVKLLFQDITIETNDLNNQPIVIQGKIIANLLYSKKPNLSNDETRALYVYFIMRHPGLKSGNPEFKEALRSDPYFNALQIKFGYAITCHKAQGGEWDHAFIDYSYSHSLYNKEYYQWCYTATTRCKKNLYLLNQPEITPFDKMEMISDNGIAADEADEAFIDNSLEIPEQIELENDIQKGIFSLVHGHINNEFIINDIRHFEWRERYFFSEGSIIDLSYNKKQKISNLNVVSEGNNAKDILGCLDVLKGRIILAVKKHSEKINLSSDKPYLKEFYEKISQLMDSEIQISNIDHLEYCERYYFASDSKSAVIDYYYDGKGRFTKINPQVHLSNSHALLDSVSAMSLSLNGKD